MLSIFKRVELTNGLWYQFSIKGKVFYFQYNKLRDYQKGLLVGVSNGKYDIEQVIVDVNIRKCIYVEDKALIGKLVKVYMRRNFNYKEGDMLYRKFGGKVDNFTLESNKCVFNPHTCTLRVGRYIVMKNFKWCKNL